MTNVTPFPTARRWSVHLSQREGQGEPVAELDGLGEVDAILAAVDALETLCEQLSALALVIDTGWIDIQDAPAKTETSQ